MTKMMMITWQDCPGKDSEQYPGNPGQVVSADALAACNANLIISGTRILFHIGLIIRQWEAPLLFLEARFRMTEMTHQGSYDEDFFGARHAFRGQARAQTWTCVVTLHAGAESLLTTGKEGTTTPKQAASVRVDQALTHPRSRDNGHPGVGTTSN